MTRRTESEATHSRRGLVGRLDTGALFAAIVLAGLAGQAQGQATLRFEPDRTVAVPGEVIEWSVFADFPLYTDPTAYFGGFVGDFIATDSTLGVITNAESFMSSSSAVPQADGADLNGINTFNAALLGTDVPGSPFLFFRFTTEARNGPGPLAYTAFGTMSSHFFVELFESRTAREHKGTHRTSNPG